MDIVCQERYSSMKSAIWRWGPAVIMMALIFTASGTPGQELPDFGTMDLLAKKGGHIIGYALLGIAYLHGLSYRKNLSPGRCILAVILACLYASTDEFHQRFTPNRSPAVSDVTIDTLGAAAGVSLWPVICSHLLKRVSRLSSQTAEQGSSPSQGDTKRSSH